MKDAGKAHHRVTARNKRKLCTCIIQKKNKISETAATKLIFVTWSNMYSICETIYYLKDTTFFGITSEVTSKQWSKNRCQQTGSISQQHIGTHEFDFTVFARLFLQALSTFLSDNSMNLQSDNLLIESLYCIGVTHNSKLIVALVFSYFSLV